MHAAAGWLAQHAVFEAVVKRFGPGRVRTLDSDTLLARKGEALVVHAAATAYRDRSHFDGQDVLESGMIGPKLSESGWMNRLAAVRALP